MYDLNILVTYDTEQEALDARQHIQGILDGTDILGVFGDVVAWSTNVTLALNHDGTPVEDLP